MPKIYYRYCQFIAYNDEEIDPWYSDEMKDSGPSLLSQDEVVKGNLLPSLVVPIGCKEKYEASRAWESIFAIIEEADC